jgi:hypothetical protein
LQQQLPGTGNRPWYLLHSKDLRPAKFLQLYRPHGSRFLREQSNRQGNTNTQQKN